MADLKPTIGEIYQLYDAVERVLAEMRFHVGRLPTLVDLDGHLANVVAEYSAAIPGLKRLRRHQAKRIFRETGIDPRTGRAQFSVDDQEGRDDE